MNIDISPGASSVIFLSKVLERKFSTGGCRHTKGFTFCDSTGDVNCDQCKAPVSHFHALQAIARQHEAITAAFKAAHAEMAELKQYAPYLKAAKRVESIWRGKMLPACPHCNKGIEAEKFGFAQVWNPNKQRRTK